MDPDEELKRKLKEIWAKSQEWDETPTSEEGIFIVKYPSSGINQAYIGIKLKKYPNSKRGVFVKSRKEIAIFRDLLNNQAIDGFFDQVLTDKGLQKKMEMLEDWDQIPTTVPGISFSRMPGDSNSTCVITLAINPVNELGKKIKKKNLFILDSDDHQKYCRLFNNEKVDRLSRIIDEVNDELSLEMRVAQSKIAGKYK